MNYRCMAMADYERCVALWQGADGVKLRGADSAEGIAKYLARNPGLSFVAEHAGQLIGTVMAGHDGKRGYVQHLAVVPTHRRQGIARKLVELSLSALAQAGIVKSHISILTDNEDCKAFWLAQGWHRRTDIETFSFINDADPNS